MAWAAVAGAAVAVVGGSLMNSGSGGGSTSSSTQISLDPQMHDILYGNGQRQLRQGVTPIYTNGTTQQQVFNPQTGTYDTETVPTQTLANPDSDYTTNNGYLGRVTSLMDQPRAPGMSQFGNAMDTYMNNWGEQNFYDAQHAAQRMETSYLGAPTAQASQISTPSQNNLNLAPAYQNMIYGDPANNPYLTGAIQKGINQSNNAFGNMLTDATRNLNENVLPSIRSGAIVNGSMGSSRQGIAESRALNDFSTQMGRAASQYGQNNTDAAVSAQAGAYDAGQNRALSAMSSLGGQQYQTAFNNANLAQQASLANQQAQLSTNQLNSSNQLQGAQLSAGLLNQGYTYGGNNDQYNINRLGSISGLLQPYTGLGGSTTQTNPYFTNPVGNALGGAQMGMSLMNAYNRAGGSTPNYSGYQPETYGYAGSYADNPFMAYGG